MTSSEATFVTEWASCLPEILYCMFMTVIQTEERIQAPLPVCFALLVFVR